MNHKRSHNTERILFRWGLLLLPIFLLLFVLYRSHFFIPTHVLPPCMFHLLTGYSCPGCGCTRAVQALFAGDLISSLYYHPLILYCVVLYICFMFSHILERFIAFLAKKLPSFFKEGSSFHIFLRIRGMKARPVYLYAGIILLVSFGFIRLGFELFSTY